MNVDSGLHRWSECSNIQRMLMVLRFQNSVCIAAQLLLAKKNFVTKCLFDMEFLILQLRAAMGPTQFNRLSVET